MKAIYLLTMLSLVAASFLVTPCYAQVSDSGKKNISDKKEEPKAKDTTQDKDKQELNTTSKDKDTTQDQEKIESPKTIKDKVKTEPQVKPHNDAKPTPAIKPESHEQIKPHSSSEETPTLTTDPQDTYKPQSTTKPPTPFTTDPQVQPKPPSTSNPAFPFGTYSQQPYKPQNSTSSTPPFAADPRVKPRQPVNILPAPHPNNDFSNQPLVPNDDNHDGENNDGHNGDGHNGNGHHGNVNPNHFDGDHNNDGHRHWYHHITERNFWYQNNYYFFNDYYRLYTLENSTYTYEGVYEGYKDVFIFTDSYGNEFDLYIKPVKRVSRRTHLIPVEDGQSYNISIDQTRMYYRPGYWRTGMELDFSWGNLYLINHNYIDMYTASQLVNLNGELFFKVRY